MKLKAKVTKQQYAHIQIGLWLQDTEGTVNIVI